MAVTGKVIPFWAPTADGSHRISMPPSRRSPEEIDFIFDQIILAIEGTPSSAIQNAAEELKDLKIAIRLQRKETMAAGDFTLEQAIESFGLKYRESISLVTGLNFWGIHSIPETEGFSPTPTLGKFLGLTSMAPDIISCD